MRDAWRAARLMLGLAFRADARRAVVVVLLMPLAAAGTPLMSWWLKEITDAVVASDLTRAALAAAALGATLAVVLAFALTGFGVSVSLQERTDVAVDRRMIDLTSGIPTIEHHERPEYLDKLEILRRDRMQLTNVVRSIVQSAAALIQLLVTSALLFRVHPALLALPLFGVPSLLIAGRSQRRIQQAEDDTAEQTRQALHLFDLATTAAPGKEVRVFRLEDELEGVGTTGCGRAPRPSVRGPV